VDEHGGWLTVTPSRWERLQHAETVAISEIKDVID
jgi:hypothetical protein